jgi:hypothetical protein
LAEGEIAPLQFTLPVVIRIHLVDKHSAVLSTVTGQITLCVAIDVKPPNQAPSLHGLLPHGRVRYVKAVRRPTFTSIPSPRFWRLLGSFSHTGPLASEF